MEGAKLGENINEKREGEDEEGVRGVKVLEWGRGSAKTYVSWGCKNCRGGYTCINKMCKI